MDRREGERERRVGVIESSKVKADRCHKISYNCGKSKSKCVHAIQWNGRRGEREGGREVKFSTHTLKFITPLQSLI